MEKAKEAKQRAKQEVQRIAKLSQIAQKSEEITKIDSIMKEEEESEEEVKERPEFRKAEYAAPLTKPLAETAVKEAREAQKEEFVDRLSRSFARSEQAQKLALSKDLELLVTLFNNFETTLEMHKRRAGAWNVDFSKVAGGVEQMCSKRFNQDTFR